MFAFLILACIFVRWSLVYIYFKAFCISEKIAGDEKRVKVCDTFDLVNKCKNCSRKQTNFT